MRAVPIASALSPHGGAVLDDDVTDDVDAESWIVEELELLLLGAAEDGEDDEDDDGSQRKTDTMLRVDGCLHLS